MRSTNHIAAERARVERARRFSQKWEGRGYEKGDTHSFWLELLRDVVGMEDVTTNVRFERSTADRGFIDVVIPDARTVVEQKSLGIDLDKPEMRQGVMVTPFAQAKRYVDSLRNSQRPDTIIVSSFDRFRIHDLDQERPGEHYIEFTLAELPEQLHLLDFLVDPQRIRQAREERVSLDAGVLIGKLYDLLRAQYVEPDSPTSQHSLNVLCVRLVFCLFAEDAGIFPKNAFYRYFKGVPAASARAAMKELFEHLRARPEDRDPYASALLKEFPYVNGGLFEADVEVPNFTEEILDVLLEEVSNGTDWSEISPTVFGGVFESTLNPDTRRSGGMHYTSPRNIHRVIDPLFLDELTAELDSILMDTEVGERARRNALRRYHDKLASLTFLDPACGSGNFLTETYISLRRLENKVLSELMHHQGVFGFSEEDSPLKVSLAQFHGIEINDFAVSVATTAMWIAELQANAEAQTIVYQTIQDLPLRDAAHVVLGNALTLDWESVVPAADCDYVIGNPPFLGDHTRGKQQLAELQAAWGGNKTLSRMDYVTGWHAKTLTYFADRQLRGEWAFVTTSSITQGDQPARLFGPIFEQGWRIKFAHQTFAWQSEAAGYAAVHCVIIGFTRDPDARQVLFQYPGLKAEPVETEVTVGINAYLLDAPNVLVGKRTSLLSPSLSVVDYGSKPTDDGNFILDANAYQQVKADPVVAKYVRPYVGSRELINGGKRWCLWMVDLDPADLRRSTFLRDRVQRVAEFRGKSKAASTRNYPHNHLFRQFGIVADTPIVAIPEVSSENRHFMPVAHLDDGTVLSNKVYGAHDRDGFLFGVVASSMFITWQKAIGGRLESRLSFSSTIVWNNLPLPSVSEELREQVIAAGEGVLAARAVHPDWSLADHYNPLVMTPELRRAHAVLDQVVDKAFGAERGAKDNVERLHVLFRRYAELTASASRSASV